MADKDRYEQSIKAVHDAEQAVYEAQANGNSEHRQEAIMKLQLARELVGTSLERVSDDDKDAKQRLKQAEQQLNHLENAEQAIDE